MAFDWNISCDAQVSPVFSLYLSVPRGQLHLFRTVLLSTSAKTWVRSSSPPLHWLLVFCCSQSQWSWFAGSPGTSCWFSSWARAYLLSSLLAVHDGGPSLTYVNMDGTAFAVNISLFFKGKRKTDGRDYSDGLLVAGYEEQSGLYYGVNYDLVRLTLFQLTDYCYALWLC